MSTQGAREKSYSLGSVFPLYRVWFSMLCPSLSEDLELSSSMLFTATAFLALCAVSRDQGKVLLLQPCQAEELELSLGQCVHR